MSNATASKRSKIDRIINVSCFRLGIEWKGKPKPGIRNNVEDSIDLRNGMKLSAQASAFHHCFPRSNDAPWTELECMVYGTNGAIEILEPYLDVAYEGDDAEGMGGPCRLYAYVPVDVVKRFIADCGGEA